MLISFLFEEQNCNILDPHLQDPMIFLNSSDLNLITANILWVVMEKQLSFSTLIS